VSQLTMVLAKLGGMRSTLEAIAGASELMLRTRLSLTQVMRGAFLPTTVEGDVTPESDEGGHLTKEGKGGEEGNDGGETSI